MKTKLTTMEKRAVAMCEAIKDDRADAINVLWSKSKTWGQCPRIEWLGEKAAYASGCGYCKHSAVLAVALRFLGATDDDCQRIHGTAGRGVSSVQAELRRQGWKLDCMASGPEFDCYTITRCAVGA